MAIVWLVVGWMWLRLAGRSGRPRVRDGGHAHIRGLGTPRPLFVATRAVAVSTWAGSLPAAERLASERSPCTRPARRSERSLASASADWPVEDAVRSSESPPIRKPAPLLPCQKA